MFVKFDYDFISFCVMLDQKLLSFNITLTHDLDYFKYGYGYLTFDVVRTEPVVVNELLIKQVLCMTEEELA